MKTFAEVGIFAVLLLPALIHGYRPLQPQVYRGTTNSKRENVGDPLYLTPYIQKGDIDEARKLSEVTEQLDGLDENSQPKSYSGFFTVKESTNSNMFFWFVPATQKDPADAPVVIWLQGGPGASSLYGMLEVHGPFYAQFGENNTVTAVPNKYTWARKANMLYIDNPIGAGFSHGDRAGIPSTQEEVAVDLYEMLQQFFQMFPEYQTNDFYPFGESYAGKFVPTITRKIHDENKNADNKIHINLKGMGIGDGWMSPPDSAVYAEFLYHVALVDDHQKEVMLDLEREMKFYAEAGQWDDAFRAWDDEFNYMLARMGCYYGYNIEICDTPAEDDNYEDFLDLESTRKAIHVGTLAFGAQSNAVFNSMIYDFMQSERENVEYLLERYPTLIYDGNFDIICDHYGILQMFKAMRNWSGRVDFFETESTPYKVFGKTAGYHKKVHNLSMFVMRNAGHMVPQSQPQFALHMFSDFLNGDL